MFFLSINIFPEKITLKNLDPGVHLRTGSGRAGPGGKPLGTHRCFTQGSLSSRGQSAQDHRIPPRSDRVEVRVLLLALMMVLLLGRRRRVKIWCRCDQKKVEVD